MATIKIKIHRAKDSRPSTTDGPAHPDPDRVGGQIAVHLANGAWLLARHSLDAALEEAKEHAAESGGVQGQLACARLPLALRIVNKLERYGIQWADDLASVSDERLLAIPGIGPKQLGAIHVALQNAGFRKTAA